jgi:hypothetical protein
MAFIKPTLLKLGVYAVLAGAFLWLAFNSHMDLYPCRMQRWDYQHSRYDYPRDTTCSLMWLRTAGLPGEDRAELLPSGWVVALLVQGVAPYLVAAAAVHLIRRKKPATA